jgi:glycine betaine/proline transport system ATP-binding protein
MARCASDEGEIVPVVRATGVYKVFGKRAREGVRALAAGSTDAEVRALGVVPAVVDVSFEVEAGEIFVVMGLSGSGKSTLIRTLNGLLPTTAGGVEIDGADITAMSAKELRAVRQHKISMVFQHFALFPHRTVLDNAAYGLQVQQVAARRAQAARARPWTWSASTAGRITCPASCRAACASGSGWRGRSPRRPTSC